MKKLTQNLLVRDVVAIQHFAADEDRRSREKGCGTESRVDGNGVLTGESTLVQLVLP